MTLSIFVEPVSPGYRASLGGPLALTADAPTADEAVEAVRSLVAARLSAGGQFRTLTVTDTAAILAAAKAMSANPHLHEFHQAIEEYRREHNTVPEAD